MFRRFLRHKVIRDNGLLLIFPKPPLFPRLLPGTFVGNVNLNVKRKHQSGELLHRLGLTSLRAGFPREHGTTRRLPPDSTSGSVLALGGWSADHAFDNPGKPIAGVGKAVEVVLALAAAVHDSPMPQQGKVVAHGRLAHVELLAQPPDMELFFGEQGDNPESGRVADLLEQDRCPLNGPGTQQDLVVGPGSLRGLLLVEDRCRHRNLTPKELDRLEAGGYITRSAGGSSGPEGL